MNFSRITIISGHYGSGKTNIAVSLAYDLKKVEEKVAIADIDIVNPYFRTKDNEQQLERAGIRLICSEYANSNVDIPALPQDMYAVTDDKELHSILDVGGDERGALALGRISPAIREENDYQMLYVVNKFRPLTKDADSAIEVMREIEAACGLKFTAIINNSNLGAETTADDVISSLDYAAEISQRTELPVLFTSVNRSVAEQLNGEIKNLYVMEIETKL
ncbi:MAG: hypothetical protein IJO89_05755 [Clostridia bacterium]|nr:hypothetical protein [Clostridia bacterium]MBQ9958534.1 hypothetical protein [Clostridia bacterium]